MASRTPYLNNPDLLREIHLSKSTFCYYTDPKYRDYDFIVNSLDEVTQDLIDKRLAVLAAEDLKALQREAREKGWRYNQPRYLALNEAVVPRNPKDFVVRVMTWDHIPPNSEPISDRRKNPNKQAFHQPVNFEPFKHYVWSDQLDGWQEVGRSHWRYALDNGEFCADHGRLTNNLGKAFMLLVERLGRKGNFRNYTYLEDMKARALMDLTRGALRFNEARSNNPFAYFTQTATNSFIFVLNSEKKQRDLRDDLLEDLGFSPSSTRQLDNESRK